ncbi:hypothetical protein [Actinocrispum wychmicini]|uniref:DUF3558 family protein n=1 Tax=Actinocrispum wychmicini TaxID=1213861 RepID=A0A4R2JKQ3_9PSEU|nr:hypothetical protein [Actinocrispum wychmicini]TCO59407.1 hypothetical protein EV192_104248 [Actinocrispum wychmicini]
MTESDDGRDDQRAPGSVEHPPDSFATAGNAPPPYLGQPQTAYPHPGYGYPPPAKPRRTGWIVAGVAAVVIALGAGVAIGVVVARQSPDQPPKPATAPVYSMNAVSNACDLVDPAPLTAWSPTPASPPQHREVRPSVYGAGSLSCQIGYSSDNAVDTAEILVDADFTNGDAPPSYDGWKRGDTAKTGAGMESGPITGIGTQGYWHSETYGNLVTDTRYLLAVLDGNVSVRVRLNVSRDKDDSQVHRAELESIAEAQVRKTLNGLKQN